MGFTRHSRFPESVLVFLSASFSRDGNMLLTSIEDRQMLCQTRLWDVCTSTPRVDFGRSGAHYVWFSDGKRLLRSGGGRREVLNTDGGVLYRFPFDRGAPFTIANDGENAATFDYDYTLQFWNRRRPEHWWGLAWLPEFWLTVAFAVAFVWSVWRDRRTL
jgi:hypothetical protein